MIDPIAEICFWICVALIGYTFAGYPLLLQSIDAIRKQVYPARAAPREDSPEVSVVLCVCNEEKQIVDRLTNLLEADYPHDRLEILVVSDGSTDQTAARAATFPDARIRVIAEPTRQGKAHGINRGVESATGEIIVFADSRQQFAPDTIRQLVNAFSDNRTGAVSGSLEIAKSVSSTGKGIDFYWKLEKRVRRCESGLGTTIGCTGAVYAIRKNLFRHIPSDTLLDDVVIPMMILMAGHRVLFEPHAIAVDPQSLEPSMERIRKRRTLAGNYQMLFRYPHWLLPWKNRAWWELLSHKYLRLAAPWLLLLVLLSNIALAGHDLYRLTLAGQIGLYAMAGLGLLFPRIPLRIISLPAGFLFLNLMAIAGLLSYLRETPASGWKTGSPP